MKVKLFCSSITYNAYHDFTHSFRCLKNLRHKIYVLCYLQLWTKNHLLYQHIHNVGRPTGYCIYKLMVYGIHNSRRFRKFNIEFNFSVSAYNIYGNIKTVRKFCHFYILSIYHFNLLSSAWYITSYKSSWLSVIKLKFSFTSFSEEKKKIVKFKTVISYL